jgi:hypothetical protein
LTLWLNAFVNWTSKRVFVFSLKQLVTIAQMSTGWFFIVFFTRQNGTTAVVHTLDNFMTWSTVWIFWWIARLLHTGVSSWTTAFSTFDQTVDLFTFAFVTVWFFNNWAIQELFFFVAVLAWEALVKWLAFVFEIGGFQVLAFFAGWSWFWDGFINFNVTRTRIFHHFADF